MSSNAGDHDRRVTRTALVSDVHGNAVALRAVDAALAAEGIGQVVCLGDMVQGGSEPAECVELLRERGWPVVLGNADAFLLDPATAEGSGEAITERQLEMRAWSVAQLTRDQLAYIAAMPATVAADLGDGRSLLACHAVPSSYDPLVFPTTPEAEFRAALGPVTDDVVAGGHIHLPYVRRVGPTLFVNPGSAGFGYDHEQPDDDVRADPWASYAVVTAGGGRLGVELRRLPLDVAAIRDVTRASGIPYADALVRRWTPR